MNSSDVTVVIDAGARYGMHPSWTDFKGPLNYYAFEPDKEEAAYLESHNSQFSVENMALSNREGTRNLHITKHRGLCSFLEPDVDSEWFRNYRPGSGDIERVVEIDTTTVDDFARRENLSIDFLKVDTEGTEQDVIEGASFQIENNVLGVRTGVYFQGCYRGQSLISRTLDFFAERGFFMLNLDYFGYGTPRNAFFRKPDPVSADSMRYGVIISSDAVWVRTYDSLKEISSHDSYSWEIAVLKYAYFCLLNHAGDLAVDVLERYLAERQAFETGVMETRLYKALRAELAAFLGKWRCCEDDTWAQAKEIFNNLFHLELCGGSGYWAQVREFRKDL